MRLVQSPSMSKEIGYGDFASRAPDDLATLFREAGFDNLRMLTTDGYHVPPPTSHRATAFLPYCYFGAQRLD